MALKTKLAEKKVEKRVRKLRENPSIDKRLSQPVDVFKNMIQLEDETVEKIVMSMLDPENVEMKTRVNAPLNLTRLEFMGMLFDIETLPLSKKVIETFCKLLRVNEVSFDGKSREEIVRILSEAMKQERSLTDKLASPPE